MDKDFLTVLGTYNVPIEFRKVPTLSDFTRKFLTDHDEIFPKKWSNAIINQQTEKTYEGREKSTIDNKQQEKAIKEVTRRN